MLSYFLRTNLFQSKPFELDPDILSSPERILLGVEDRIFQFRAGQIEITLDNTAQKYTSLSSSLLLKGQEEILVFEDQWQPNKIPLWAGTIDPDSLRLSDDEQTLIIRILQHGSLLNQFKAGKLNWGNSGNIDTSKFYRYTKQGSQWQAQDLHGNTLEDNSVWATYQSEANLRNTILEQSAEIFATPDFVENLTDLFERQQYQKFYHFATDSGLPGGPEEFPVRTGVRGNIREIIAYTGPYTPYRHPDFTQNPDTYENTPLTEERAAWVKSPELSDQTSRLRAQPVITLLQNLLAQFNTQMANQANQLGLPYFPYTFQGTAEDLRPPAVSAAFNLLDEENTVRSIDLITSGSRTYLLVNWLTRSNGDPTESNGRIIYYPWTLYEILNGSFLSLVREEEWYSPQSERTWQTARAVPRFARAISPQSGYLYIYQLQADDHSVHPLNPSQARISWRAIEINLANGTTDWFVSPSPTYVTADTTKFYDFSVDFSLGRTGTLSTAQAERPPNESLSANGFSYKRQGNRLIAHGSILLDRVALEYKDSSFAKIFSELAVITDSAWYITPARELIFRSRALPKSTVYLPAQALNSGLEIETQTLLDEPDPTLSLSGIKVAKGHLTALANYYTDNRFKRTYTKSRNLRIERTALTARAANFALEFDGLSSVVQIADSLHIQPPFPHSIELWFYPYLSGVGIVQGIISKGTGAPPNLSSYGIYIDSGKIYGTESQTGAAEDTFLTSPTLGTVLVNQWNHVCLTSDGSIAKIFLNGNLIFSDSSPAFPLWNNTYDLKFGCIDTVSFFTGLIRNVRLFSILISDSDVAVRYNHGLDFYTNSETGLISAWLLNEGSGNIAADVTGVSPGTISNARWITLSNPIQTILPGDKLILDRTLPSLGNIPIVQELEISDFEYFAKTLSA